MANPPQVIGLDTPQQTPPQTIKLDTPPQTIKLDSPTTPSAPPEGFMSGVVGGILQGASESMGGAAGLAEKALGKEGDKQIIPHAMQSPNVKGFSVPLPEGTTPGNVVGDQNNAGHMVGEGAENVAEFVGGDAALEGLAKATKLVELADKYPIVAKTLALAKEHPVLAKMITGAGKGAVVGGAQGAVKASGEGENVAKGAEGGAVGGGIGGGIGEGASKVAEDVMKSFGVGTEAGQKAMQGLKPAKKNINFLDDFHRAAPVIDALPDWKEAKDAQEGVEAIKSARQNWWEQQVQPVVAQHSNQTLNGFNISKSISDEVPSAMRNLSPEEAQQVDDFAKKFQSGHNLIISVGDAEDAIEHYNAKLAKTGFWEKSPQQRNALMQTDPEIIQWKAAGDAIRDELYNKLEELAPGTGMADKKMMYGALRNVENQLQGRVNVEGRQAPISLKQAIGLAAGLSMGRLEGLAAVALPMVDRNYNSAIKLAQRGVKQAATGEEGPIAEAAKGAVTHIPDLAAPAGAAAGREIETSGETPTTP